MIADTIGTVPTLGLCTEVLAANSRSGILGSFDTRQSNQSNGSDSFANRASVIWIAGANGFPIRIDYYRGVKAVTRRSDTSHCCRRRPNLGFARCLRFVFPFQAMPSTQVT